MLVNDFDVKLNILTMAALRAFTARVLLNIVLIKENSIHCLFCKK